MPSGWGAEDLSVLLFKKAELQGNIGTTPPVLCFLQQSRLDPIKSHLNQWGAGNIWFRPGKSEKLRNMFSPGLQPGTMPPLMNGCYNETF